MKSHWNTAWSKADLQQYDSPGCRTGPAEFFCPFPRRKKEGTENNGYGFGGGDSDCLEKASGIVTFVTII